MSSDEKGDNQSPVPRGVLKELNEYPGSVSKLSMGATTIVAPHTQFFSSEFPTIFLPFGRNYCHSHTNQPLFLPSHSVQTTIL